MMNTLDISRLQFAITITFHIIFPALSIGLATWILIIEGLWLKTNNPKYYQSCRFWSKILALTFGMGIISGLAMEVQMGTNWGQFSSIVGPVLGVLFVSEALTAFFIEAIFLGVMLFAWGKLNKWFHYFCTSMVWIGVNLSAFWIMAANSWMQTPSGVIYANGHFIITSWWHIIFNHSTLIRYLHMLLASYIATLMIISAVACYYLIKKHFNNFAKFHVKFAIIGLCLLMPCQIFIGDEVGLKVRQYQPIKTAAIEGLWSTQKGAPFLLFANIDQKTQKNHFSVAIPHLASLINTHHWNGKLIGLDAVKKEQQPNVNLTFYSFRFMVGLGLIMLVQAFYGLFLLFKQRLYSNKYYLKLSIILAPAGLLALITGWYTAETGRQPWVVYNILSTDQAVSIVPTYKVIEGFLIILLIYGVIFCYYFNRYVLKIIKTGPLTYTNPEQDRMIIKFSELIPLIRKKSKEVIHAL